MPYATNPDDHASHGRDDTLTALSPNAINARALQTRERRTSQDSFGGEPLASNGRRSGPLAIPRSQVTERLRTRRLRAPRTPPFTYQIAICGPRVRATAHNCVDLTLHFGVARKKLPQLRWLGGTNSTSAICACFVKSRTRLGQQANPGSSGRLRSCSSLCIFERCNGMNGRCAR